MGRIFAYAQAVGFTSGGDMGVEHYGDAGSLVYQGQARGAGVAPPTASDPGSARVRFGRRRPGPCATAVLASTCSGEDNFLGLMPPVPAGSPGSAPLSRPGTSSYPW